MTIAELKDLLALLEKAQAHAKLQAAYTPKPLTAALWRNLEADCQALGLDVNWAITATSEAMNHGN
jgi:hypothetical protein